MDVQARGQLKASVRFDGGWVTVSNPSRLYAGRGEVTVHLQELGSVVWKPAGWFRAGWIRFTVPGTVPLRAIPGYAWRAAREDPNTVTFNRRQQPQMELVRAAIEQARRARYA